MGSSHSHYDHEREEHERRVREEERVRHEAEEARRREEKAVRWAEEARRQQEQAQRQAEDALRREDEARQQMEEMQRREDEARRREEQAEAALEESRRRNEELRQREDEARQRGEMTRQLAEQTKRAAWEAQQREAQAKACEEVSKRQELEAKNAAYKAQEEAERVKKELDQTNFYLSIGVQPELWPTEEEFILAQASIEYNSEKVHLAVCGSSGAGKSSLINTFRGLANRDAGAAPTGVVETTMNITRYPDTRAEFPYSHFVWFDAPGAGTLDISGWQYFNEQGLFLFDVIILVYDVRFTQIDVAIIQNCERYRIPLYIVRSKADTHIGNVINDLEPDSDERDGECYKQARQIFIDSTRGDFERNLQKAKLTKRDVFIVSSTVMRAVVTKRFNRQVSNRVIDEASLHEAVLKETHSRLRNDYLTVVKQNMVRASPYVSTYCRSAGT